MDLKLPIGCILLSLAATVFPASSQDFDDDDDGPVEYVRVCDVYGTGFYYIPGTETCLKISGYVRYQNVQNPSNLGVGTVVAGGTESFLAKVDRYLNSIGGGAGFEYGLGKGEARGGFGPDGAYHPFIYGNLDFGGGDAHSSGWAAIGENDVTLVGFTYAEALAPDNTGLSASSAGFGLSGNTKIDYLGGEAELGYGRSYGAGDPSKASIFVWRGGLYIEGLDYDSRGEADLTFDDIPYGGYFQRYDYDSRDLYGGFRTQAEFHFQPVERVTIALGANVKLGYHSGEADFSQVTGIGGGNQVVQQYHYKDTGFVVGGGLSVKADYAISPTWTAGIGYEFDVVPEVTSVDVPANPDEQPISFSGEAVKVHKLTIRVSATFN